MTCAACFVKIARKQGRASRQLTVNQVRKPTERSKNTHHSEKPERSHLPALLFAGLKELYN